MGKPVISCESESLLDLLLAFSEAEVEVAEMLAEVPKLIRKAEPCKKNPGWFVKSWVFLVGKKKAHASEKPGFRVEGGKIVD